MKIKVNIAKDWINDPKTYGVFYGFIANDGQFREWLPTYFTLDDAELFIQKSELCVRYKSRTLRYPQGSYKKAKAAFKQVIKCKYFSIEINQPLRGFQ